MLERVEQGCQVGRGIWELRAHERHRPERVGKVKTGNKNSLIFGYLVEEEAAKGLRWNLPWDHGVTESKGELLQKGEGSRHC